MELHQVRYFVTLAKALSFTKAAEQCGISQPALSKAVAKLEAELGGSLIFRERQLTQLTELGRHVLPSLERTLSAAQDVGLRASQHQQSSAEPLKIALAPTISPVLLAEPLHRLAEHLPSAAIEFSVVAEDRIGDALLGGEVSAALSVASEEVRHTRIESFRLCEETVQILSAASAPSDRDIVSVSSLPEFIWVETIENDLANLVWDAYDLPNSERKVRIRSHDASHWQALVASGFGVMAIPQYAPAIAGTVKHSIEAEAAKRRVDLCVVAGREYPVLLGTLVKIVRVFDWRASANRRLPCSVFHKRGSSSDQTSGLRLTAPLCRSQEIEPWRGGNRPRPSLRQMPPE